MKQKRFIIRLFSQYKGVTTCIDKNGSYMYKYKKERLFFDIREKPTHLVRTFEDQELSDITWANLEITDSSWN